MFRPSKAATDNNTSAGNKVGVTIVKPVVLVEL